MITDFIDLSIEEAIFKSAAGDIGPLAPTTTIHLERERPAMIRLCLAFALFSAIMPVFAQPAEVQRTVLIRGESSNPDHESVVARVDIASRATIGRHTHFGDEIGYVQEGDLEMYVEGEALRKLKTGDAFIIPEGKVHSARNIGNGTAHVIVTYVIAKGKPMAVPVK